MKIESALAGIRRVAFDTSPLIYLIEKHPLYFDRMFLLMQMLDQGHIIGSASVLTLTEVLVHPLKTHNSALAQAYETILRHSAGFHLVNIDVEVGRRAAELRSHYGLRTPDALHLAAAVENDCDAFITNDRAFNRVVELKIPRSTGFGGNARFERKKRRAGSLTSSSGR